MSNELVKKGETRAVIFDKMMTTTSIADASDIIIPKVLVMQGLSKMVAAGTAVMGEIRDSLKGKLLAAKDKPVEIIPFHISKSWVIFEKTKGGKFEFVSQVPWSHENARWEWNETIDGREIRRDLCRNVYCLFPDNLKTIPHVISFRRTSAITGKKLYTYQEELRQTGKPLCAKTFLLSAVKTENDLGSFYVFDVVDNRETTPEELNCIFPWYEMIQNSTIHPVDDSDFKDESDTDTTTIDTKKFGRKF